MSANDEAALDAALESGVRGYFANANPDGTARYSVTFNNGHLEHITAREMDLMEAAYLQGMRHTNGSP